jgi:hypothetical protein
MASEAWPELARLFRDESARCPDLRHAVVRLPADATGDPIRWDYLPLGLTTTIPGDPIVQKWVVTATWPEPGHAQVFYGVAGETNSPAWRRFAGLARIGVVLAVESGVIVPALAPDPDPARPVPEDVHFAGTWMNLVYRLARERRPGSLLRVQESSHRYGPKLPDGMNIAELPIGVFTASAYAAEQLAQEAEPPRPAQEAEPPHPVPNWDGLRYRLEYRGVTCLEGSRKAPGQDAILEGFQAAGWPGTIPSPFPVEKQTRDTVDHLNKRLKPDATLRFSPGPGAKVVGWRPVNRPTDSDVNFD